MGRLQITTNNASNHDSHVPRIHRKMVIEPSIWEKLVIPHDAFWKRQFDTLIAFVVLLDICFSSYK